MVEDPPLASVPSTDRVEEQSGPAALTQLVEMKARQKCRSRTGRERRLVGGHRHLVGHYAWMPSEDLIASWRRTEGHLKNALQSLTNPEDEALSDYRHFSEHNELGLALDVLVDVATAQRAPRTVWEALLAAAEEMNIGPDDETHGGSRRKIDDRLAAGAESFELQALLNDWDPIGVYDPATNFPDDEYDCLYEPLLARLRRGEDGATIGAFLETELRDHFGLDPQWSRPYDFAVRLVNWFAGRS